MKNTIACLLLFFAASYNAVNAQISKKELLAEAVKNLIADKDMKYGTLSFTVLDATTNKEIYTYQPNLGLPAASTQKIITSIAAYEILGKDFRFESEFHLLTDKKKQSTLAVKGSYDPTLGSYRYTSTKADLILENLKKKLAEKKITNASALQFLSNVPALDVNATSDGWIFEDLGNYYGAPCSKLIWRENKYDVYLDTKTNNKITYIKSTSPAWLENVITFKNNIEIGPLGSGDNSCIYKSPFDNTAVSGGSIGIDMDNFEASGSVEGEKYFWYNLNNYLNDKIPAKKYKPVYFASSVNENTLIYKHKSPSLDSINYWFLRKSINIYGESLLRTIAQKIYGDDEYRKGIRAIQQFGQKIGVDSNAIHLFDGCGLSPQNRITSKALCTFMQYARNQYYYKPFYEALPIINDISMKSGSIHGVRAYTGYISSSDNNIYTFAIVANNYTCSGKEMQSKLWKVLDALK